MKILFVDDDQGLLDQAKYVLENKNPAFDVIPVTSGEEALDFLEENEADIVVSDYMMPGMDGLELLEEIREEDKDIPFLIFTGKGREEIAMKALNLGADRYFRKGGDPNAQYQVLGQAIEQEVEHKRAKEEKEQISRKMDKSERRYKAIFESIGVPLVTLVEDKTIDLVNREFVEMGGYSKEEVEGKKNWYQFVAEKDQDDVKRIHQLNDIERGLTTNSYEFKFIDKYGNEKSCLATMSILGDGDRTILSLFDFTRFENALKELKLMEEAFLHGGEDGKEEVLTSLKELFTAEGLKNSIKDWSLEEILVLLIKNREGASGKELMADLNDIFGIELSSSIVYPKLHDLEEKGILWINEQIRTKEYKIEDTDEATELIDKKLKQLFGIYTIIKLLETKDDIAGLDENPDHQSV